mgnify:CR=1 FL=1
MEILVEKINIEPWMHAYSSSKTYTQKKRAREIIGFKSCEE